MKALLVPIGTDTYAVPLEIVREVVVSPAATPLPTAPGTVLGLFNLRGEIVPVLDTGMLLGVESVAHSLFAVVVESTAGTVALAASGEPRSDVLEEQVATPDNAPSLATFAIAGGVAVLIDVDALVAPAVIGTHEA